MTFVCMVYECAFRSVYSYVLCVCVRARVYTFKCVPLEARGLFGVCLIPSLSTLPFETGLKHGAHQLSKLANQQASRILLSPLPSFGIIVYTVILDFFWGSKLRSSSVCSSCIT